MKAKRLLYALGSVDDEYIAEILEETIANPRRSVKKLWLIAALVAVMLAMAGCVAYVLSLKDLKLAEGNVQEADFPEVTEMEDFISLQGFSGTKNYLAAKEWYEFRQAYDPDGKILQSLSNKETMMPEEYWSYSCYTPEMTAKVDEICEKYGLNKQGMPKIEDSEENLCQTLSIDRIIREDAQAEAKISPKYFFRTGTFSLFCETKLTGENTPWVYPVEYQYRCVMKSDFDEVYLNVGDVIYGEQKMTREALEAFADTFEFSFVPQPVSDENWEALQQRPTPEEHEEALMFIDGESYAEHVRYLLENASRPEMLDYALLDIDGDGAEELLIARRQHICCIYTIEGNMTVNLLEYPVGRYIYNFLWEEDGMYMSPSPMYLCEGNAVACIYKDLNTNRVIYHFAVPVDGEMVWMEEIAWEQNKADASYYEFTAEEDSNKGYNDICTPISEERYNEILSSYVRVKVEWTSLREYPME